jgi:release factor glutamine methyltransferase
MKIQELLQNPDYKQKRVLENLICHFFNISREKLWLSLDQQIEEKILNQINQAYDDFVIQKKPLEYVLGYVEFMNNKFKIDHRALIPRPETEYMIQAVNDFVSEKWKVKSEKSKEKILFDIGTGCGVLGLSVMLHNLDFFDKTYLSEYIDDTMSLAVENYEILKPRLWNTKIYPVKSNLLQFIKDQNLDLVKSNIILVWNLPYIPDETFDTNVWDNVKNREPRPAFVWWEDWLDYYREMFQQIYDFNIKPTMFLEMMTWQVDILRQEFWEKIEFEEVKTFHFNIRIVKAWLK